MVPRARIVFWALIAAWAALLALHFPALPDRVASHFGVEGVADGWMSKSQFLVLQAFLIGLMAASFEGLSLLLPRLPDPWINLPAKDYWLHPDRRAATLRKLSGMLYGVGAITVAYLLCIVHWTIQANLRATGRLEGSVAWATGIHLVAVGLWTVWFVRSFRRPTGSNRG